MRHDRPARHPAVVVPSPCGVIYELDVWLSAEELAIMTHGLCMPSSSRLYEPWLRITCGLLGEAQTAAGVEVIDQDDGA